MLLPLMTWEEILSEDKILGTSVSILGTIPSTGLITVITFKVIILLAEHWSTGSSDIQNFDEPNGDVNNGSVEYDNNVLESYALEKLARNAYKEAEKQ
ncbi:hypothetical protein Tco_0565785 [Tanacetum coccineum]